MLKIPDQHKKAFGDYISLDSQTRKEILDFLQKQELLGSGPTELFNKSKEHFHEKIESIQDLFDAFFTITRTYFSLGTEEGQRFLDDVSDAILALADYDLEIDLKSELNSLISSSLGVTSKIFDLLLESEKSYINSKIITDIRPVFNEDLSKEIKAAVIVHNLSIKYRNIDNTSSTIIVTMDEEDLRQLNAQIDRALKKEKSLFATLDGKINIVNVNI